MVPPNPAVFSAWGLLHAPPRYDLVRTVLAELERRPASELERVLVEMEAEAVARLGRRHLAEATPSLLRWADVRFGGQDFTLQVRLPARLAGKRDLEAVAARFTEEHRRRFGYVLDDEVVLVNLRVSALAEALEPASPPLLARGDALKGRRQVFDRAEGRMSRRPVYERTRLGTDREYQGPAIVEEPQSTHLVPAGCTFHLDELGNLHLSVGRVGD